MPQHVVVPSRLRTMKDAVPAPVKAAGRQLVRSYGVRTAGQRPLPEFLVIGAKRGGTTSLWNWLVTHPSVLPMYPAVQQIKSPHYFDINFDRGEAWYRSHFPTRAQRRLAQRRTGGPVVTGEASPYYMFHPLTAGRVHRAMPDVKVIVSLRNPVDRAYSNYQERLGSAAEPLLTFEEAIAAEPARLQGEEERIRADPHAYSSEHDNHSYLARGRYLEHLEPWLELFDPQQVLILLAEDLPKDAGAVFARMQSFLGILQRALVQYPRHNHLPVAPMRADTRQQLVEHYRPHNAALAARLGIELPWDR